MEMLISTQKSLFFENEAKDICPEKCASDKCHTIYYRYDYEQCTNKLNYIIILFMFTYCLIIT